MEGKSARQRQKEKHELIFKYVKSLTPFGNPEAQQHLHSLRAGSEKKGPVQLDSKVLEVSVLAARPSKRVSFADEPLVNAGQAHCRQKRARKGKAAGAKIDKIDSQAGSARPREDCSPERVQNDLMELQRSVFATFKIRHEGRPSTAPFAAYNSTKAADSEKKREVAYYSERPPPAASPAPKGESIVRAKSCSSISRLGLQSSAKQRPAASSAQMSTIRPPSGLSRSESQAASLLQSQITNRSSVYSQQSHNLMVEIFKQKLQTKRVS